MYLKLTDTMIWLYISANLKFQTSISFFTALAGLEMIARNTNLENYPLFSSPQLKKYSSYGVDTFTYHKGSVCDCSDPKYGKFAI